MLDFLPIANPLVGDRRASGHKISAPITPCGMYFLSIRFPSLCIYVCLHFILFCFYFFSYSGGQFDCSVAFLVACPYVILYYIIFICYFMYFGEIRCLLASLPSLLMSGGIKVWIGIWNGRVKRNWLVTLVRVEGWQFNQCICVWPIVFLVTSWAGLPTVSLWKPLVIAEARDLTNMSVSLVFYFPSYHLRDTTFDSYLQETFKDIFLITF